MRTARNKALSIRNYVALLGAIWLLAGIGSTAPASGQHHIFPITFDDANCNGAWDGGEAGLGGWTVFADANSNERLDASEPSAVTDDFGIGDLPVGAGTHEVVAVVPPGRVLVTPASGMHVLTVPPDQEASFGSVAAASIDGVVYDDQDGDGEHDAGEPGLGGWAVGLTGTSCAGDALSRTAITEADGSFAFEGLPPGTFEAEVEPMDDWTQTQPPMDGAYQVSVAAGENEGPLVFGHKENIALPATFDFGDAPDTYGTTLGEDGPRHIIEPDVALGALIDPEDDGQPEAHARGDDNDGTNDDDGIVFTTPLIPGQEAAVTATVTTNGYLYGWIDFDGDGTFAPDEQILDDEPVLAPSQPLVFDVPPGIQTAAFARFRFTTTPGLDLQPTDDDDAPLPVGEVEDYALLDFGDLGGAYATTFSDDGPRHVVRPDVYLGAHIDTEGDGQPVPGPPLAHGDDSNALDDEDGLAFVQTPPKVSPVPGLLPDILPVLQRGLDISIRVDASVDGYVSLWLDLNGDDVFQDDERLLDRMAVTAGANTLLLPIPNPPVPGTLLPPVWAGLRLRFSTQQDAVAVATGLAPDGEVEDYDVIVADLDCGDAPDADGLFATTLPYGGCHVVDPSVVLGSLIDAEADGQPSADARGDDDDAPFLTDDEDGTFLITALVPGEEAILRVTATQAGFVSLWLVTLPDASGIRDWANVNNPACAAALGPIPVQAGINYIHFCVPTTRQPKPGDPTNPSYLRVRYSSVPVPEPDGIAYDGEVEDSRVFVVAPGTLAWLTGQKFNDRNANGMRDANEPGLDGWVIQLIGPQGEVLATDTTKTIDLNQDGTIDPNTEQGLYLFQFDPGEDGLDVLITEEAHVGWVLVAPADGYRLEVQRNDRFEHLDFANARAGMIHGTVFEDRDGDGARNPGDPGLPGWVVYLDLNENGTLEADEPRTTTTEDDPETPEIDEEGSYRFSDVLPGTYTVAETLPDQWMRTFPADPGTHTATITPGDAVEALDFGNQQTTTIAVEDEQGETPTAFRLYANYPNPFNPQTTIRFDVPTLSHVVLRVFDVRGRAVATLVDQHFAPGRYEAVFDARGVPSGLYIYQIEAPHFQSTRRMLLVK